MNLISIFSYFFHMYNMWNGEIWRVRYFFLRWNFASDPSLASVRFGTTEHGIWGQEKNSELKWTVQQSLLYHVIYIYICYDNGSLIVLYYLIHLIHWPGVRSGILRSYDPFQPFPNPLGLWRHTLLLTLAARRRKHCLLHLQFFQ